MGEDFNLKKKRNKISVKLRAPSFARDHWTAHKKKCGKYTLSLRFSILKHSSEDYKNVLFSKDVET